MPSIQIVEADKSQSNLVAIMNPITFRRPVLGSDYSFRGLTYARAHPLSGV